MRKAIFEFGLPPEEVSPNARPHHMAKARAVKKYKADCILILRRKWNHPKFERVRVTLTFRTAFRTGVSMGKVKRIPDRCYRTEDRDNGISSVKAAMDAIVVAGILPDDKAEHVLGYDVVFDPDSGPGLTIELREVDQG